MIYYLYPITFYYLLYKGMKSMKVVIAIDSFKGSLSTFEAGNAAADGIRSVYPNAEIVISPLADGGEGTVDAVISATNGIKKEVLVTGPLGAPVHATYGIIKETQTAVMEMAAASGITLIEEKDRNPLFTTTYGVGEMIADAVREGCQEFLIGIGGSATNDGGVGMMEALGVRFLNQNGMPIARGAAGLRELSKIDTSALLPALSECRFRIACDVKNPLCGEMGCSAIYGPQKGATKETIALMDAWLAQYAKLTKEVNEKADATYPGCGAAGGLGFAFLSYLPAELCSGIELVIDATNLETHIQDADFVITGEGRLDGQSCMGKAPTGVAMLAKKYEKTVIALAGCVTDDAHRTHEYGIDAFFPIVKAPCTLAEAMDQHRAYQNLKTTAEEIFRLIKAVKS